MCAATRVSPTYGATFATVGGIAALNLPSNFRTISSPLSSRTHYVRDGLHSQLLRAGQMDPTAFGRSVVATDLESRRRCAAEVGVMSGSRTTASASNWRLHVFVVFGWPRVGWDIHRYEFSAQPNARRRRTSAGTSFRTNHVGSPASPSKDFEVTHVRLLRRSNARSGCAVRRCTSTRHYGLSLGLGLLPLSP